MRRAERAARGLLQDPDAPRLTVRAQRAEKNLGGTSFQTWITGAPAARVRQAIEGRGAGWRGVHEALVEFGCVIEPKGSGLVVTTTLFNGRVLAAKASIMGRWASKASLERALGPYRTPSDDHRSHTGRRMESYEQSMLRERREDPGPRLESDDPERLARRAARADARRALAERFEQEQAQGRAERVRQREALRQRQERERRALAEKHRQQRRELRAAARARGFNGQLAQSLSAFQAAVEREALQRRQATERRALTDRLPRGEVWRLWLERQALAGDEAAQSALRGIRYREQRKRHRQDGIEGEEIVDPRPLILGRLRIEVDAARLVVIYRRGDGIEAFRDTGPRIVMQDKSDESLEAALRVAAQKYGGRVQMTGSDTFQERAARMATRLGIAVHNPGLQAIVAHERQRLNERWVEPRSPEPWMNTEDRRPGPTRSRGLER
jgi:conjugative element/phage-associated large polyvalent protein/DNA relaxase TraI-like protein